MIQSPEEYEGSVKLATEQSKRLVEYEAKLRDQAANEDEVERGMQPLRTFHLGLVEEIEHYEAQQTGDS